MEPEQKATPSDQPVDQNPQINGGNAIPNDVPEADNAPIQESPLSVKEDDGKVDSPSINGKSPLIDDQEDVPTKDSAENETSSKITEEEWIKKSGIGNSSINVGKDIYGNEAEISAEELKAMAPLLREADIPPESAQKVLELVANITRIRTEADAKVYGDHIERMAKEQKAYFGEDFERVRKEAISGIREIFPTEYGKLLSSLPEVGFSKEFMEGMAKVGRMFTNDDGTGGTAASDNNRENWNFKRWLAHDSAQ